MTHEEIAARRLYAQGLTTAPSASPGDAVRSLVAMQAQEYAPATWSVGEHTTGADEASVGDRPGTSSRPRISAGSWS